MKTSALTSTVFALTAATLLGEGKSDIEFLRARADAHERKIVQLEKEIIKLKSYHQGDHAAPVKSTAKSASSTAASATVGTYVVKKGDILTRIAYRNKTTVAAIMKENGLRNDRINIGQKLRIPGAAPAAAPAPAKKSTSSGRSEMAKKPAATQKGAGKHVVAKGETFYSIARKYKVSVSSLLAANPSVKPSRMGVGQSLIIDGNAVASKKSSSSRSTSTASKPKSKVKTPGTTVAEFVDPPKPQPKEVVRNAPQDRTTTSTSSRSSEPAIRTITVHQQMTYGQFASKYGASTTQLNALNGLSLSKNTMLAKGSELYVPKF